MKWYPVACRCNQPALVREMRQEGVAEGEEVM